jgi:hypothetical protein
VGSDFDTMRGNPCGNPCDGGYWAYIPCGVVVVGTAFPALDNPDRVEEVHVVNYLDWMETLWYSSMTAAGRTHYDDSHATTYTGWYFWWPLDSISE